MKTCPDPDGYYRAPGAQQFNVKYVGGVVFNRVMHYHFFGQRPKDIEWVWCVETNRYATKGKIAKLCAGRLLS